MIVAPFDSIEQRTRSIIRVGPTPDNIGVAFLFASLSLDSARSLVELEWPFLCVSFTERVCSHRWDLHVLSWRMHVPCDWVAMQPLWACDS